MTARFTSLAPLTALLAMACAFSAAGCSEPQATDPTFATSDTPPAANAYVIAVSPRAAQVGTVVAVAYVAPSAHFVPEAVVFGGGGHGLIVSTASNVLFVRVPEGAVDGPVGILAAGSIAWSRDTLRIVQSPWQFHAFGAEFSNIMADMDHTYDSRSGGNNPIYHSDHDTVALNVVPPFTDLGASYPTIVSDSSVGDTIRLRWSQEAKISNYGLVTTSITAVIDQQGTCSSLLLQHNESRAYTGQDFGGQISNSVLVRAGNLPLTRESNGSITITIPIATLHASGTSFGYGTRDSKSYSSRSYEITTYSFIALHSTPAEGFVRITLRP